MRYAKQILPLRRRGNLLLCSLLLGNTLVNALIATLLDSIASGIVGTICTTSLIVVFGEIIPQAVCSRNALLIGAKTLPLVYVFVAVCFIFAYPISRILDSCLGREISGDFSRTELLSLIHMNVQDPHRAKMTGLTELDGKLLSGALTFRDRTVGDVMTPLGAHAEGPATNRCALAYPLPPSCVGKCFTLNMDAVAPAGRSGQPRAPPLHTACCEQVLDYETFLAIMESGVTRVPVFERGSTSIAAALLHVKDLLGVGFERELLTAAGVRVYIAAASRLLSRI